MRCRFEGAVLAATAFAVGGCNQVFDLDVTEVVDAPPPVPPDFDRDGVPDAIDNCHDSANVDQLDGDEDGFGDACDFCPALGSVLNHDEDGDTRGDECDLCPAVMDFQDDLDGNGVGDACAAVAAPTVHRKIFDPFIVLDETRWRASQSKWTIRNDSAAPSSAGDNGLELLAPLVGDEWQVSIGFSSARRWTDGDQFGLAIRNPDGSLYVSCFVTCSTTCSLILRTAQEERPISTTPMPVTSILVAAHVNPLDGFNYVFCGTDGVVRMGANTSAPLSPHAFVLAMPDIPTTYAEALQ